MALSTDMLAAFVKVAEHLSVSAAAADLDLGKGVVSKRVGQLEAAVKTTLFSRSTRKMALTPAGEAYLGFARRALLEVGAAEERLRELRSELSGQIRITAPVSWGQAVLARALPGFLAQHQGVEVELLLTDRLLDIACERVDLALRFTQAATPELVAEPVAGVRWVIAAAPAYLVAQGTPRTPADLLSHACMAYWRESSDDAWSLKGPGGRRHKVKVRGRYHANDPAAVAEAALAGLGIALLPAYLCEAALADGRLAQVLPKWTPETKFGNRITALATPERMAIGRNRSLLAYLKQHFAGAH